MPFLRRVMMQLFFSDKIGLELLKLGFQGSSTRSKFRTVPVKLHLVLALMFQMENWLYPLLIVSTTELPVSLSSGQIVRST